MFKGYTYFMQLLAYVGNNCEAYDFLLKEADTEYLYIYIWINILFYAMPLNIMLIITELFYLFLEYIFINYQETRFKSIIFLPKNNTLEVRGYIYLIFYAKT